MKFPHLPGLSSRWGGACTAHFSSYFILNNTYAALRFNTHFTLMNVKRWQGGRSSTNHGFIQQVPRCH